MARLSVTTEQIALIISMGKSGSTQREICVAIDSTKKVVGRILREAGIKTPRYNPANKDQPRNCDECQRPMFRYGGIHRKWMCRPCKAAYNADWCKENQSEIKVKKAVRHIANKAHNNAKSKARKVSLTPEQRKAEQAMDRRNNGDRIRSYTRRWAKANRHRTREYQRCWARKNRAKCKVYTSRWRSKNPDKMAIIWERKRIRRRGAPGSHTAAEWRAIVKKQKSLCQECGVRCIKTKDNTDPRQLTKDHRIPLDPKSGGTNYAYNLDVMCKPCNSRKHAKLKTGDQHSLFDRVT